MAPNPRVTGRHRQEPRSSDNWVVAIVLASVILIVGALYALAALSI